MLLEGGPIHDGLQQLSLPLDEAGLQPFTHVLDERVRRYHLRNALIAVCTYEWKDREKMIHTQIYDYTCRYTCMVGCWNESTSCTYFSPVSAKDSAISWETGIS
jgi:hypothetical protein